MFNRLQEPTGDNVEANNIPQQSARLNDLSWDTRVYCFAGCLILSMVSSILSSPFLFYGKYAEFAVMTSLGSIISICGTFFLSGPMNQLKKMFEPSRLIATIIYLMMIVLTLVAGLVFKNPILALIFIVGQYVSMIWYSLSFIPYARETVIGCLRRCF